MVLTSGGFGLILATVFGAMVASREFRHKTATDTYLDQPSRTRVLTAKVIAAAATGLVFGLAGTAVTTGADLAFTAARGYRLLDAVSAARAAQARGTPKGRDGAVEAIRALMVAKRSARAGRTQTINQARALIVTGPDDLGARFARHTTADLVAELVSRRPRPGAAVGYATRPGCCGGL
ncbi:MAG TPA: hypothetical protein VIV12_03980 [Streptosporangiaceae bacterium]